MWEWGTVASDCHPCQTARVHVTFLPHASTPHVSPRPRQLGDLVPGEQHSPSFPSQQSVCSLRVRLASTALKRFCCLRNLQRTFFECQLLASQRVGARCILRTGGGGSSPGTQSPACSQGREGSRGGLPRSPQQPVSRGHRSIQRFVILLENLL